MFRMFHKRHPPVGSRPGTLIVPHGAVPPRIRVIHYTEGEVRDSEVTEPGTLDRVLSADGVSWIDVRLGARMLVRHPALTLVGGAV